MFAVMFEVRPAPGQDDAYLGFGRMLRPELERIEGFIDNTRYRSLSREGWILSLSTWRDEKALVRWRTHAAHHDIQEHGRSAVLADYHLRVGQLTRDTAVPEGCRLEEQRLDETEIGRGKTVTLIEAAHAELPMPATAEDWACHLGFRPPASGLVSWDVFDAVLTPGAGILLVTWLDQSAAEAFERSVSLPVGARLRRVRVIRDYGLIDRREAPQFFPPSAAAHHESRDS